MITKNVMAAFATLKVIRADDSVTLTYYGKWNTQVGSTVGLLKTGDGKCFAWARFFLAVLDAQGIVTPTKLTVVRPKDIRFDMYVKTWTPPKNDVPNNPGRDRATFPYINTYELKLGRLARVAMVDLQNNRYEWVVDAVKKTPGAVSGQGNADPLAIFGDHEIVRIKVGGQPVLFDPSYGLMYTDEKDIQTKALSFLGVSLATAARGIRQVKFIPITDQTPMLLKVTDSKPR